MNAQTDTDSDTTPVRRLFFALDPPADVRAALHGIAHGLSPLPGGRLVAADRLHLTLLFLGMVPVALLPNILGAAGRVSASSFTLGLERIGYWRHAGVLWLGAQPSPSLLALHESLRAGIAAGCPEIILDEREFRPHVTLMRGLRRPPHQVRHALETPLVWPVSDWVLMASADSGYEVLGRWPCGEDA
ncbi:MAG: RNA 2',3'-cyclic phosphodiesterase [Gammaproteobacteria bacterium]|nr:RNA 2',3'-cyclic phosphodiesterase [Gammaproteobacteria bacterium]